MKRTNFILQAAVAAAFGVTAAQAATFNGAGPTFAKEALKGATSTTTVNFAAGSHAVVVVNGTEGYINRLQPLNIKVQLNNSAKFGSAVVASQYKFGTFDAAGTLVAAGTAAGATALPTTVVGGGAVGDTFVTFSVDPTGVGLLKGGLDLGTLVLKNIQGSLAAGASVSADITLIDPTTNTTLDALTGKTIASAANAVSFEFTPTASPAKIDVATGSIEFTGANANDFDAGTVDLTFASSYLIPTGVPVTVGAITNVSATVAGLTSFDAFAHAGGVYLGTAATVHSIDALATASTAAGASFLIPDATQLNHVGWHVYFNSDDKTAVEEGTPTVQITSGVVNNGTVGVTGIAATSATSLAAMLKNGYSTKYPFVFAAGDAALGTTYVRLVNNSSVDGKVFFTFKDKAGAVVGTANASAAVAAKSAALWTDGDIEKLTGALPTGGYYRLEISSTLPSTSVVTQAYVLTPNMSISNITSEK